MKITILTLSTLAFLSTTTFAETKPNVPAKEASQIFKAAGFSKTKHGWEGNCDTGEITTYKDLNGDGLKDNMDGGRNGCTNFRRSTKIACKH